MVFLLYWHVTHHAAVKSTNTLWPVDVSWSTRPGSQASQPVLNEACTTLFSCTLVMFWPVAHINIAQAAIVVIACTACLAGLAYAAWDYWRVSQIYLQPEARALAYQDNTLAEASKSWLFADQALFAELILTPLTPATAERVYASAGRLLHYSPEPRVVIMLIESAVMLGKDAEALAYLARFKAAFPKEHAAWAKANSAATKD